MRWTKTLSPGRSEVTQINALKKVSKLCEINGDCDEITKIHRLEKSVKIAWDQQWMRWH